MSYAIDAAPLTVKRLRHRLIPGRPQGFAEQQVPGVTQRFGVEVDLLGDDLVVTADLTATGADVDAALAAMRTAVRAQNANRGGGQTHTVTLNGEDFENMRLIDLEPLGTVTGFSGAGPVDVFQRLRWTWRRMA